MRKLFRSEQRGIEQLIRNERGRTSDLSGLEVLDEVHSAPERSPSFNSGFCLKFGALGAESGDSTCIARPVIPNALGLELFLMVHRALGYPLSLEFLAGTGIDGRHFSKPCGYLQDSLATMLPKHVQDALPQKPILQLPYVRVFWIYDEVSFLIFSRQYSPLLRCRPLLFHDVGTDHEIDTRADANQHCIDGSISLRHPMSNSNSVACFRPRSSRRDK